jgi:CheY-like chemotaxis protein
MDNKLKVLIAEDEQDARIIYVDILTAAGWQADGVADGEEALKKMEKVKYDLVLLDIIMPNRDGIGALREIKAHPDKYGNMPVYMLTNIASDVAIENAITLGAKGYILKSDTDPTELVDLVKKALD